jgi:hypothetical protein
MALLAKTGSYHVILSDPLRQGRVGHVTVRETLGAGGVIGPRVIRWYKAATGDGWIVTLKTRGSKEG